MNNLQYCHYPKSAGRMVEQMLIKKYGRKYYRMNGNFLSNTPGKKSDFYKWRQYTKARLVYFCANNSCIGGHIRPLEFVAWKACFIREPVERMYSEYHFFKRKNPEFIGDRTFLQYAMNTKKLMVPYSDFYGGNEFQFIGFFDRLEVDVERFAEILGVDFEPKIVNATEYEAVSEVDRCAAEEILQEDVRVYKAIRSKYGLAA